eukprot:GHVS01063108.1.p1 GENE.GHVS01063108.1~~GHVS01063108.1.p1  ORF type:complete len:219 (+),score=51.15 GHVS01063108.1:61-717(+)
MRRKSLGTTSDAMSSNEAAGSGRSTVEVVNTSNSARTSDAPNRTADGSGARRKTTNSVEIISSHGSTSSHRRSSRNDQGKASISSNSGNSSDNIIGSLFSGPVKQFDLKAGYDIVGGELELYRLILSKFGKELASRLDCIVFNHSKGDWLALGDEAHSLKGAASYVACVRVEQLCAQIQQLCEEEEEEVRVDAVGEAVERLNHCGEKAKRELRKLRGS